jgi:hypothetical protein
MLRITKVMGWSVVMVGMAMGRVLPSQASSPLFAATLLRATVASMEFSANGRTVSCQGMVMAVRGPWAYVATAKHCGEAVSPVSFGPAGSDRHDPTLRVTITYANGGEGTMVQSGPAAMAWHYNSDDVIVLATFTRRPAAYLEMCAGCYGFLPWAGVQSIPVVSVLQAGGGEPVLSTGMLRQDASGQWTILLPVAPGTSGAPVVDLSGNLVGITSSGLVAGGAAASFTVKVVPGKLVLDLVKFAEGGQ